MRTKNLAGKVKNQELTDKFTDRLKAGDIVALKELYINNYKKVEQFVLQNSGTTDHAKDIYQEAFLAVWQKVKGDKFVEEKPGSVNGYLYQIAKNKWTDYLRSSYFKKTSVLTDTAMEDATYDIYSESRTDEEESRLKRTMEAFKGLGEDCKTLLIRFYFKKMSLRDIASLTSIDEASARNKKYRCMQKLRELTINPQQ